MTTESPPLCAPGRSLTKPLGACKESSELQRPHLSHLYSRPQASETDSVQRMFEYREVPYDFPSCARQGDACARRRTPTDRNPLQHERASGHSPECTRDACEQRP